MKKLLTLLLILAITPCLRAQSLYYPPLTGSTWQSLSPASLGWCTDKIDPLYAFLEAKHTKAFVVLKDGKIVLEKYFGTFTQDSSWYWASAGKTLTALMVGIAQKEGYLSISDPTSQYLGAGWTSATPAQEAAITIRHQLTMTSGLDDDVPDYTCTLPSCLQYKAPAGTRWAYHNAPYTLLHRVVDSAVPGTFDAYFASRIAAKTGMTGAWFNVQNDRIFISKPRTMARFGLLLLGAGVWNGDTILKDPAYLAAMRNSSQTLNPAYGYLTWLNGKAQYMLPASQFVFPGPLVAHAPADLYAALGKNDQKLHVVPSMGLVVVRMGEEADASVQAPSAFDDSMWVYLNKVICNQGVGVAMAPAGFQRLTVYPNPAGALLHIKSEDPVGALRIYDATGRLMKTAVLNELEGDVPVGELAAGMYWLRGERGGTVFEKE